MARRKCNSTRLDKKHNRIAWHVELQFEGTDVVHTAKRVSCCTALQEVRKTPWQRSYHKPMLQRRRLH